MKIEINHDKFMKCFIPMKWHSQKPCFTFSGPCSNSDTFSLSQTHPSWITDLLALHISLIPFYLCLLPLLWGPAIFITIRLFHNKDIGFWPCSLSFIFMEQFWLHLQLTIYGVWIWCSELLTHWLNKKFRIPTFLIQLQYISDSEKS